MTRRLISFFLTTLFLLFTGVLAGVILAVLGLALGSALQSLQNSRGEGLLDLLVDLFFLLINVLAVSTSAAPDGAWSGLFAAAAISLVYGLSLWLFPQLQRRWLALLFAMAGALGAALGARGMLAEHMGIAAIAGAIFGLLLGPALSKRQQNE